MFPIMYNNISYLYDFLQKPLKTKLTHLSIHMFFFIGIVMNNEKKKVKHDTNGDCFHKINSHVLDKKRTICIYI